MIGPSAATLARVLLATVVGVLPVFLLGSLSVLISGDVPLDEQRLGAAAAAFWTASALLSWVAGHLGLYHLAIVRLRPHAPAAASGAAATALFLGSIVGPLGFGTLASTRSFAVAWLLAGVWLLLAALGVLLARRLLVRGAPE